MVRMLVLYPQPNDVDAFERYYHDVHIPLAKKLPGLRRYSLSRNVAAVRGGEPYYLVAELAWDDRASLQQAFQSPEGQASAKDASTLAELCPGMRSVIYDLQDIFP